MRRSALLVVCLAVFVDMVGFGIILPVLPFHAGTLGGAGAWVGALLTAYAGAQFCSAPILGALSDRYGRRPLLLASLAGSAVSLVLTGLAGTLALLLLARLLAGAFGGAIAVGQAYAVDLAGDRGRTRALGLVGASIGLGFVVGPGIGAGLSALGIGFAGICFAAAGLAVVNIALGLALLPSLAPASPAPVPADVGASGGAAGGSPRGRAPQSRTPQPRAPQIQTPQTRTPPARTPQAQRPRPQTPEPGSPRRRTARTPQGRVPQGRVPQGRPAESRRPGYLALMAAAAARVVALTSALRLPAVRPVLLAVFGVTFAFAGMETTFALLGARRFGLGPASLGAVFAGVGVVMIVVQGVLVGRLAERYGDRPVAMLGAVLLAIGLLVLPFTPAWIGYPALALVAAGQGLLTPTTAAMIAAAAGGARLGGALGIGQSAASAARATGPIVAGVLFDLGPATPYVLGAVLCLGATLSLRAATGLTGGGPDPAGKAATGGKAAARGKAADPARDTRAGADTDEPDDAGAHGLDGPTRRRREPPGADQGRRSAVR